MHGIKPYNSSSTLHVNFLASLSTLQLKECHRGTVYEEILCMGSGQEFMLLLCGTTDVDICMHGADQGLLMS